MTALLTHTAPVPLPAMQEPGPASVREAAAPAAQQAPADTSASAHGRGTDRFCGLSVRRNRGEYPRYGPRDDTRPVRHGDSAGTSHPEPHCRPTPPRRKARTRWRRIRCIPGRRQRTRCRSFRWKARCGARPTRFGATRRQIRSSVRHRPSFRPVSCRRLRLRPSPKTPSFRASSCCSQRPTPYCSTAIWATYGCC